MFTVMLNERKSPLLSLPRELRDEIYHNVFDGMLKGFPHGELLSIIATYGVVLDDTRINDDYPSSAWYLASKQLAAEAMEQFHRLAEFTVCLELPENDPGPLYLMTDPPYDPSSNQPLMQRARHLEILGVEIRSLFLSEHEGIIFNNSDRLERLSRIDGILRNGTAVRTLKLEIFLKIPLFFERPSGAERYSDVNPEYEPHIALLNSLPKGLARLETVFFFDTPERLVMRHGMFPRVFDNARSSLGAMVKEAAGKSIVGADVEWREEVLDLGNFRRPQLQLHFEVTTAEYRSRKLL